MKISLPSKGLLGILVCLSLTLFHENLNLVHADITTGLRFHADFESPNPLHDKSTYSHNGTAHNGASLVSGGGVGNSDCYTFDGINDYVSFINTHFSGGNDHKSLSGWFKMDQLPPTYSVAFWGYGSGNDNQFQDFRLGIIPNGAVGVMYNGGGLYSSPNSFQLGTWNHVVATFAGGTNGVVKLYLNGVEVAQENRTLNPFIWNVTAGRYFDNPNHYFKGEVDELRHYARELSASDVLELYNLHTPQEKGVLIRIASAFGHLSIIWIISILLVIYFLTRISSNRNSFVALFLLASMVLLGFNGMEAAMQSPTNFQATWIGGNQIRLTWNDPNSETDEYYVPWESSSDNYATYTPWGFSGPRSEYTTSRTPGYTYKFSLYAKDTDPNPDQGAWATSAVYVTIPAPIPDAPTNLQVSAHSTTSTLLTWTDNSNNENNFDVNWRESGGSWDVIILPANTTSYIHTGLSAGNSYEYQVRATDGGNKSDWTSTSSITLPTTAVDFPYSTDFESFTIGSDISPLEEIAIQAEIISSIFNGGAKGLQIGSASAEAKLNVLGASSYDTVYLDYYIKPSLVDQISIPDSSIHGGPANIAFSQDGSDGLLFIQDGNGSGGGSWIQQPFFFSYSGNVSSDWIRLSIKLDYIGQTWDLLVDGLPMALGLGFDDNSITELSDLSFINDSTDNLIVDDLNVSNTLSLFEDSDSDGMLDSWETHYFGSTVLDGSGDFDTDGLSELEEYNAILNPTSKDTDADGLDDNIELAISSLARWQDPVVQLVSGSGGELSYETGFEVVDTFALGNLHGQNDWRSEGATEIVNTTDSSGAATQAIELSSDSSTDTAKAYVQTEYLPTFWVSFDAKLNAGELTTPANNGAGGAAYFQVNSDNKLCYYDGASDSWVESTKVITTDTWYTYTVSLDYTNKRWSLYIDDQLTIMHVTFADETLETLSEFCATKAQDDSTTKAYLDNFKISNQRPSTIDNDADDDLLSNEQEMLIGSNPLVADTDGDNVKDGWEYLNGLDPLSNETITNDVRSALFNVGPSLFFDTTNPVNLPATVDIPIGTDLSIADLDFTWVILRKPEGALDPTITDATDINSAISFSQNGIYKLKLELDGTAHGYTPYDELVIFVSDQSPVSYNYLIGQWDFDEDLVEVVAQESEGDVWLEAEWGNMGSLWRTSTDGNASNGQYVKIQDGSPFLGTMPPDASEVVSYKFNVSTAGTYTVWGRVIAPTGDDDSFWVQMDDGNWVLWSLYASGSSWLWKEVKDHDNGNQVVDYTLSAGIHTLKIAYREDGTLLDKLFITSNVITPSGTGDAASNGLDLSIAQDSSQWDSEGSVVEASRNNGQGWNGSAMEFVGDDLDDAVIIDQGADLLNGLEEMTLMAWVWADEDYTDDGFFTGYPGPGGDNHFNIRYDAEGWFGGQSKVVTASLKTTKGNSRFESTANEAIKNQWFHFTFVYNQTGLHFYRDGQLLSYSYLNQQVGLIDKMTTFIIGQGEVAGKSWNGKMDEVRLYGKALTAEEVNDIYLDSDGDGIPDSVERQIIALSSGDAYKTFADVIPGVDSDGDRLDNEFEIALGANMTVADTDGDGLDDGLEYIHGLDLNNDENVTDDTKSSLFTVGPTVFVDTSNSNMLQMPGVVNLPSGTDYSESDFTFEWTLVRYPGANPPVISDANDIDTYVTFTDLGVYKFKLTFKDAGNNYSPYDELTVFVSDQSRASYDSLIGFWDFNEASGDALDQSQWGSSGTITEATRSGGWNGTAMDFAGDDLNDKVVINQGEDLLNGLDELTIMAWVWADETNTDDGFITGAAPISEEKFLNIRYDLEGFKSDQDDTITAVLNTTEGTSRYESIGNQNPTGEWFHITLVWDQTNFKIYRNGSVLPSAYLENYGGMVDGITTLIFGQSEVSGQSWNGKVDEVKIFGEALTSTEVFNHFNDGDGDGLSDEYERWIIDDNGTDGFAIFADVLPDDNYDDDDLTNIEEMQRDADPTQWESLVGAPTNLSGIAITYDSIDISWTKAANTDTFEVFWKKGINGTWSTIAMNPGSNGHTHTGLDGDSTYYYKVRAQLTEGPTVFTPPISVKTPVAPIPLPNAPTGLSANVVSSYQINLNWSVSEGNATNVILAQGLYVDDAWQWAENMLPPGTTSFEATLLQPNVQYKFKAACVNSTGRSGWSNEVTATTPDDIQSAPNPSPIAFDARIDGPWVLRNDHSKMVMTLQGGNTNNGTPIVQQNYDGSDSQHWEFNRLTNADQNGIGNGDIYNIRLNSDTSKYLSTPYGKYSTNWGDNTVINSWRDWPDYDTQNWQIILNSQYNTWSIYSMAKDHTDLETENQSPNSGAAIEINEKNPLYGSANYQRWQIWKAGTIGEGTMEGLWYLQARNGAQEWKRAGVEDFGLNVGANVDMQQYIFDQVINGYDHHKWHFIYIDNDEYKISNRYTNKWLTADSSGNVYQDIYDENNLNQRWKITPVEEGQFRIDNVGRGQTLLAWQNGTDIRLGTYFGLAEHKWTMEFIGLAVDNGTGEYNAVNRYWQILPRKTWGYLEAKDGSMDANVRIIDNPVENALQGRRVWEFTHINEGKHTIMNFNSKKYMTRESDGGMKQQDYTGNDNQLWYVAPAGLGLYNITSVVNNNSVESTDEVDGSYKVVRSYRDIVPDETGQQFQLWEVAHNGIPRDQASGEQLGLFVIENRYDNRALELMAHSSGTERCDDDLIGEDGRRVGRGAYTINAVRPWQAWWVIKYSDGVYVFYNYDTSTDTGGPGGGGVGKALSVRPSKTEDGAPVYQYTHTFIDHARFEWKLEGPEFGWQYFQSGYANPGMGYLDAEIEDSSSVILYRKINNSLDLQWKLVPIDESQINGCGDPPPGGGTPPERNPIAVLPIPEDSALAPQPVRAPRVLSTKPIMVHSSEHYLTNQWGEPTFYMGYYAKASMNPGYYINTAAKYLDMIDNYNVGGNEDYPLDYMRLILDVGLLSDGTSPAVYDDGNSSNDVPPVPFKIDENGAQLDQFEQLYWDGLIYTVNQAYQKGITLQIDFFNGETLSEGTNGTADDAISWEGSFWNEIQQPDPPFIDFGTVTDVNSKDHFFNVSYLSADSFATAFQKSLVDKAIDTIYNTSGAGPYYNLLYSLGNDIAESDNTSDPVGIFGWMSGMASYVDAELMAESGYTGNYPIASNMGDPMGFGSNPNQIHILDHHADPKTIKDQFALIRKEMTDSGVKKPVLFDPDDSALSSRSASVEDVRKAMWYAFTSGAAGYGGYTADYDLSTDVSNEKIHNAKYLKRFIKDSGVRFWEMVPMQGSGVRFIDQQEDEPMVRGENAGLVNLDGGNTEYVVYVADNPSLLLWLGDTTIGDGPTQYVEYYLYEPTTGLWTEPTTVAKQQAYLTITRPVEWTGDWAVYARAVATDLSFSGYSSIKSLVPANGYLNKTPSDVNLTATSFFENQQWIMAKKLDGKFHIVPRNHNGRLVVRANTDGTDIVLADFSEVANPTGELANVGSDIEGQQWNVEEVGVDTGEFVIWATFYADDGQGATIQVTKAFTADSASTVILTDYNSSSILDSQKWQISERIIPANNDADRDGMSNEWEDLYSPALSKTKNDAYEDPDGDGVPNIFEYLASVSEGVLYDPTDDGTGNVPPPIQVDGTTLVTIQDAIDEAINQFPVEYAGPKFAIISLQTGATYSGAGNNNLNIAGLDYLLINYDATTVVSDVKIIQGFKIDFNGIHGFFKGDTRMLGGLNLYSYQEYDDGSSN